MSAPTPAPRMWPYPHRNLQQVHQDEAKAFYLMVRAAAKQSAMVGRMKPAVPAHDGKIWCDHCNVRLRVKQVRGCARIKCNGREALK